MQKLEELKNEGRDFIEGGYGDLPELAKISVNIYMRGLKDGMALALRTEHEKHELAAVGLLM